MSAIVRGVVLDEIDDMDVPAERGRHESGAEDPSAVREERGVYRARRGQAAAIGRRASALTTAADVALIEAAFPRKPRMRVERPGQLCGDRTSARPKLLIELRSIRIR